MIEFTRRGFFGTAAGLIVTPTLAQQKNRALRIAHLTDVHVQPELRATEGMTACLKHLKAQPDKPALVLLGGDHVMDSFAVPRERALLEWDLWNKTLEAECPFPSKAVIGNHDIFGWDRVKSGATGQEKEYGKQLALDRLKMPSSYYSFEQAGWKFIALDSVQPGQKPGTYAAYLDEPQYKWLAAELAATPVSTPVLIWSHIPILCGGFLVARRETPTADLKLPAGGTHTDAGRLVKLFEKHPNVKACLSGHTHLVEDLHVKGVRYLNNGAVSARWWKGPIEGFREGYALLDLFTDGTLSIEYIPYDWKV